MIKAHKIRLNPTKEQEEYFWKAANVARFAFNWVLGEYNKRKAEGQKVKILGKGDCLIKEFVVLRSQSPWIKEVSTWAYQGAFRDLQDAINRYFEQKKKGELKPPSGWKGRKDGKPYGWPRFKAKEKATPSFYQANDSSFRFNEFCVKLPIVGWVNVTESLRFKGKVMGARVIHHANHWWLSVQVEIDQEVPLHNQDAVGIDLGIKYLAVTSDGQVFENPKPLANLQRKLARFQRSFDRMERGGKNWHKMKAKIADLHYRIACIRSEASHQLTTRLTKEYGVIGIEDLNIEGMKQNRSISKAISDAALYEKRRQLEYKANWNGGQVVVVSRWFPSSKLCSGCNQINPNLKLSDREWTCPNCGQFNHRDGNAAINIKNEAIRILEESGRTTWADTLNACGAFSDGGAMKQENVNL